jgi:sugar lactone lactonase YvrE
LTGELTPGQLVAIAEAEKDSVKLCEAYYYAGEFTLLNGAPADALDWFRKCIDTGVEHNPEDVLEAMSEYELAEWRLSRLETQVQASPHVVLKFNIPEHDLFPENIAYDSVSRNYYLGSLSQSRILVIREDGSYQNFVSSPPPGHGLLSSAGMKVDAQRRVLWVCTGRFTLLAAYDEAPARTGVLAFDLEDGTPIGSWLIDQESDYHIFNDLALATDGDVYATTTLLGRIYRISANSEEMELVYQLGEGRHNNGIALDGDEKHLFLTVDRTIHRLELATGDLLELDIPEDDAVGTDGLYVYNQSLVAVKPRFKQISQIFLNDDATASDRVVTLVQDHKDFAYPTTGVIVGDILVFVATSYADVPRNTESAEQHPDVLIYEIALKAD